MAKELNENTGFNVSIKTMIAVGFAMAGVIGMWFALQADIAEARELPKPDVTKMEFQMKDANIRLSIENTEKTVEDLKIAIRRMEDKIDRLR
tara:strand:+ start:11476 stop:11751 length:276 start_codon:yes stop_codon:yes gene_type:complete